MDNNTLTAGNRLKTSESPYYELIADANRYIRENDILSAYPCIQQATEMPEAADDIIIKAGLLAASLHKFTDAKDYFTRAVEKNPHDDDCWYNLALVQLELKQTDAAEDILKRLISRNPDEASYENDLAVILAETKDSAEPLRYWQSALKKDPNNSLARNNAMKFVLEQGYTDQGLELLSANKKASVLTVKSEAEIDHWRSILKKAKENIAMVSSGKITMETRQLKNAKVAIIASMDTFVKDIASYLQTDNEVKLFTGNSTRELMSLMEWSDIAWFEWSDQLLIEATRLPKVCPIVCRLHSYEVFTDMPSKVDWTKVDQLLFVNDSVMNLYNRSFINDIPKQVIHNAVDANRFTMPEGKTYGKKIASVGYINYKKNPALLLYVFKKIYEYDKDYTLHIAGEHQDPRIQLYFEHFLKETPLPISFDGWVKDMPSWYADKDFIISTSLFESFHYSIAEGMASGLLPLIHNWYGASLLYPSDYLFTDPDDCLRLIKEFEHKDKKAVAEENRRYIISRYSTDDKHQQVSEILQQVVDRYQ